MRSPLKATALVLRTTDWSETSRIATLWTREYGRVRVLAKGARRLKSSFESALDLLTVCSIVFLRKSSDSLDLLTEARVLRRFPQLRQDLTALYAAYYVAELLADWTEDYDPHPALFDEALATLGDLGHAQHAAKPGEKSTSWNPDGPRLARFELVLLRELGYSPRLQNCAVCDGPSSGVDLAFSPAMGGILCSTCRSGQRQRRPLSKAAWEMLCSLNASETAWQQPWTEATRGEIRSVLGEYVTYLLGRQPRLLPYLRG